MITTAMATAFKQELFSGGHCFNGTVTPTATAASAATSFTSVSSMAGVAVGMAVTGTGVAANTTVVAITGPAAMTVSVPTTAVITGGAITVSGDVIMMALIKTPVTGTYGAASVNYTDITGNSDEVSGTGYSAGGQALGNVTATTGSTTAYTTFSPNPSWTSATFSTAGCMIYNSSVRNGGTSGTNTTGAGRCCSVHDFGGAQQVSSGTFTVLMPTANSVSALLRIA